MQKIILASQSQNRKELLKGIGIPFKIIVSDFNESQIKEDNPKIRARKIALAKAYEVAKKHQGIIISGDTFTVCQNEILEKPKDLAEARQMLKKLSHKTAVCYTGFCFLDKKNQQRLAKTAVTEIVFRKIYKEEIDIYVKKFPVTTWAAAYAASELYVIGLIENISGSLTGLTHGLPIEFLIPLLEKSGYKPKPI